MASETRQPGRWTCEACGTSARGERGSPPLYHVRECEDADPEDLVFTAED